jgi:transposase
VLTTKIHVVVDAQGLPIRLGLTAGQAHDGQIADTLLDHLVPRTIVLADKAYDADRIRELIQDPGAPKETPHDVIMKLNSVVRSALADAAVKQRLNELGQISPSPGQQTPQALAAYHKSEIEKWWPVIKAANIKAE